MREFGNSLQLGSSAIGFEAGVGDCIQGQTTSIIGMTRQGRKSADDGDEGGDVRDKSVLGCNGPKSHLGGWEKIEVQGDGSLFERLVRTSEKGFFFFVWQTGGRQDSRLTGLNEAVYSECCSNDR